jgi:NADPH-dependent F420 reductase
MSEHAIGVIGGTGAQGMGLAARFAAAGHAVWVGSRDVPRAELAAEEIRAAIGAGGGDVTGASNRAAAEAAELVILAVPYAGQDRVLEDLESLLRDKIVVTCVNPLGFDAKGPFGLDVPSGSAAGRAAELLPGSRIVGAFNHLPASMLLHGDGALSSHDVLVCGDDLEAKRTVMELCRCVVGHMGIDAGPLRMATQLEPLTAVFISINKTYKTHSGMTVSGVNR